MSNGRQPVASTDDGRLVTFSKGTVFVREIGSGEPLLLLNGLGAHTGMWKALEDNLAGFRIVEFDLPGAGQSPTPGRPIGIPQLAALAVEVMDRYEMQRPNVLGYSMGGMVAQQLASKYPERVRRLVVAASTPGVGAIQVNLFAMLNVLTPARYLSPRIYSRTIGSMVGGRARSDSEWVSKQAAIRLVHRPSWKGYLSQIRSMTGWSALPRLPKVTAPTLVIAGGDDPLAPPINAKMIAHLIPDARLLILEEEGHLMMVDERGAAHAAVREFLMAPDHATSDVWQRAVVVKASDLSKALAKAPRQLPPLSLFDSRARRRWLHLDDINHGA
ncbi:MAG: hypothetical protein NVSMB4_14700 [Acidimicrobiales bacterium]